MIEIPRASTANGFSPAIRSTSPCPAIMDTYWPRPISPRLKWSKSHRDRLRGATAWAAFPWEERAAILLRAAELFVPWRARMNASTMLGQAKTCHQAEIDASCELIDFLEFNVSYLAEILADQPPVSDPEYGTDSTIGHSKDSYLRSHHSTSHPSPST